MATLQDTRSLGELFGELTREISMLVRKEIELARVEMQAKAARIGTRVAVIAVGAIVACAGLFAIVAGLVLVAIRLGMAAWGAAFLVGFVVLAIGGLMAQRSLSALRREDLAPRETINTLKENVEWAKEHATR